MSDETTPAGTPETPETPDAPAPAPTRPDGTPRRIRHDGQPDRRHDAKGGPRVWTLEDLAEVPRLMEAEGISLRAACRRLSIPPASFVENLPAFPALGEEYQRIRPHVAAEYARRSLTAVERAWGMVVDENVDAKRGNAISSAGRNLSERLAWVAGRIDPDAWGDKVKHDSTLRVEAVVLLPPLQPVPLPPAAAITARLLPEGQVVADAAEAVTDEG